MQSGGIVVRGLGILSSAALMGGLYAVFWGGSTPRPLYDVLWPGGDAVDAATWNVFVVGVVLLVYVFLQVWAAHSPPAHINLLWGAADIGFSVLPLFTLGAALVASLNFDLPLNFFQWLTWWLALIATLIDLTLIWVFYLAMPKPREVSGAKEAAGR